MAERGRHSIHPITPVQVRVNGDRAPVESIDEILNRSTIDGIEVDMTMRCRFVSRAVRTAPGWRLASFRRHLLAPRLGGRLARPVRPPATLM
jgi:hypothetical protein